MVTMDITGKIIWTRDEPLYMSYLRYGAAASPVIYRDRVIYSYIPENPDTDQGAITGERAYLIALDLATGREVWRVDGIEGGTRCLWRATAGPHCGWWDVGGDHRSGPCPRLRRRER